MAEQAKQLLEIYTLGGLTIAHGKMPVTGLTSSKAEALLVYLAATRRTYSRETMAELLWENRPQRRSMSNLRVVLTSMRQHLSPYVEITRQTVAMNLESAYWLDIIELEKHVMEARDELRQADELSQATAARLKQTLELYQGSFLEGFFIRGSCGFEDWVSTERQRLDWMTIEALDRLIDFYVGIGEYGAALELGRRLLTLDPLREATYRKLMFLSACKGERINALEYFHTCRDKLNEELGIQPEEATVELSRQIAAGEIVVARPSVSTGRLQAEPVTLLGREKESSDVIELLHNPSCRLLTLTGPGGIGKTRLAQEVIERVKENFPDGVFFVSLAAVRSLDAFISAVANEIQFSFRGQGDASSQLMDHLTQKMMLLVLDGFEHLIHDATGLLVSMLSRSKTVKILVTSRELLHVRDEWSRPLDPLSTPPNVDAKDAETYSAVQLYLYHANRVRAGFAITERNRRFVIRICQQVGGNPLGIELAAAWTRMLSCEEIAREVQRNLDFLVSLHRDTHKRHQSVQATFQHSWNLLSSEEKNVFEKLAAFSGGFRRGAASEIAAASFPMLSALIDKSLIRSNLRGRYEMHELLHQYAAEKLAESPNELAQTRAQHARYYADFVKQREAILAGRSRNEAVEQIEEEIGNVRSAWQWAIQESLELEVGQMSKGLWFFYEAQNRYEEALSMYSHAAEQLLAQKRRGNESLVAAQALGGQGWFLYRTGLISKGKTLLQRSVNIARRHAAWPEIGFSLTLLGLVSNAQGKYASARELCQESLAISEEIGDMWVQSVSLNVLGNVARNLGEHREARELCEESLAISRASDDRLGTAISLNDLGQLAFRLGEYKKARMLCQESLEISTAIGNQLGIAISADRLGRIAQALGEYDVARTRYQDSLDRSRAIGDTLGIAISLNYLGSLTCLQGNLDAASTFCEEALTICRRIDSRRGIVFSLNHLGEVAFRQEKYTKAYSLYQESLPLARQIGNLREVATVFNGLSDVTWTLGQIQECHGYTFQALQAARSANVAYQALDTLLRVARILDHDKDTAQALRLVEYVRQHPAVWQQTRDRANIFRDKLMEQLPSDVAQKACRDGGEAELDEVLNGLLRPLKDTWRLEGLEFVNNPQNL